MSASLLPTLLQAWPGLSLRGGKAWLAIKGQATRLLADYARAADDDDRAWIELRILRLFESVGLGALLHEGPAEPEWQQERGKDSGAGSAEYQSEGDAPPIAAEDLLAAVERRLEAEAGRTISAWVEGLGLDERLALGRRYELLFGEDPPDKTLGAVRVPDEQLRAERTDVLVLLTSEDVIIHGDDQQTLWVARGPEKPAPVRFTIEPRRPGRATVRAQFFAHNRRFQELTLTLAVEGDRQPTAGHAVAARGLTLDCALELGAAPHRLSLTIVRRESSYELILARGVATRAMLRVSETQLAQLIEGARSVLHEISAFEDGGARVYSAGGAVIPAYVHRRALHRLAKLGSHLYQQLFFGPGSGAEAHQIGTLLRELSDEGPLRIQVVGERFIFPWTLLYDQSPLDLDGIDPERFWGFRHTIEYLPEFGSPTLISLLPEIRVDRSLAISYLYNERIDHEIDGGYVAAQVKALRDLPGVEVREHRTRDDLYALLNQKTESGQLLYLYCHAVGVIPGEAGGTGSSRLILTDGEAPLDDLYTYAPVSSRRLPTAPLIFLNACESARLSPYLYDGLVPYFITKGARGVIGTEASIPAAFAAEFALEVIGHFAAGAMTLGEALATTRRRYLSERRNVLGLLYALYCDADVRVRRYA